MTVQLVIFLCLYVFTEIFEYILEFANLRHLREHGAEVPEEFVGDVDEDMLRKTGEYTVAKTRFGMFSGAFDEVVRLVFIFSGLLLFYAGWVKTFDWNFILSGILFFIVISVVKTVLEIPFSLYSTFKLERRFGFNQMTAKTWITDQIKSLLVSIILMSILLGGALALIKLLPNWWWLAVWGFFFVFSIFMMYISPYVLEPLFNKFTPIDDEDLVEGIKVVLDKAGIKVKGVFKMDASRRTSHTNAYFTGIGHEKRIVLYDTLLEKLENDEIIAVLAHEAGHCQRKHIIKLLCIFEVAALIGAYIAFLVLNSNFLNWLFGMPTDDFFVKLVLLSFVASVLTWPFSPLFNILSRKFEREADDFARRIIGDGEALATALIKLSKDNLSNLHPHPFYAKFHYSHPPAIERIRYLRHLAVADEQQ